MFFVYYYIHIDNNTSESEVNIDMTPEILNNLEKEELIKVKNLLNHWQWPEELGEKPKGWDSMPPYRKLYMDECETREEIIRPYMTRIRELLKSEF